MSVEDYELGAALVCAGARVNGSDERWVAICAAEEAATTERLGAAVHPSVEALTALLVAMAAWAEAHPDIAASMLAAGTPEQPKETP